MRVIKVIALTGWLAIFTSMPGGTAYLSAQGEVEFFTFPMGARSIGMGRAFTGVSDDIQAVVWNPAGLSLLEGTQMSYSRLNSFEFESLDGMSGINNNLVSIGMPVEKYGSFGFSLEIQNYGETVIVKDQSDPGHVVNDRGYIVYATYATAIFDKLDIGLDFKYLNVKFAGLNDTQRKGSTSAIDIGALYRPLKEVPLQVGVALRNLGFALQFEDEYQKDPLPRRLIIGVGYDPLQHLLHSDDLSMLVSTDFKFRRTRGDNPVIEEYYYFGTEIGFQRMVYARVGYIKEPSRFLTSGPSFGIGLRPGGFVIDYAREFVSELGNEDHVTVGYRF